MLGLRNPAFLGSLRLEAEGGSTSTIIVGPDTFRVHTFTSSGTFKVYGSGTAEYLIIGGGGGGGISRGGGGGGAGGYRSSVPGQLSGRNTTALSPATITSGEYAIVVGNGGARGANGQASSAFGVTANAGTAGGGGVNGSGGAGGGNAAGQGFGGGAGASDFTNPVNDLGGGGGGAGGSGGNATLGSYDSNGNFVSPFISPSAGAPGAGLSSNITGTSVTRARGGGGNSTAGAGTNTGNGGGGDGFDPGTAGSSGIVIIRYKIG
jgi:hypothetical protein